MVTGFVLRPGAGEPAVATFCLATGGVFSALGAYAFAFNVWGTIGARPPAAATAPGAGRPEALLRVVRRS
jgi:hypothetical protein